MAYGVKSAFCPCGGRTFGVCLVTVAQVWIMSVKSS
jgi:hypothetical protein